MESQLSSQGMDRLAKAGTGYTTGWEQAPYVLYDTTKISTTTLYHGKLITGLDTSTGNFTVTTRQYVVQTNSKVIERCILMATDPGDLVLDPTCGSGTTAYVAEQWGRRWITIDTSRVALALARARIMGARYPYYLLADSLGRDNASRRKSSAGCSSESPTYGNVRQGFVYERVPHITLRAIANNAEIDVIWETAQKDLEPLCEAAEPCTR